MSRRIEIQLELVRDGVLSEEETLQIVKQTEILLNDLAMRNGLKLAVFNNAGLGRKYKEMASEIEHLLRHINNELEN